MRSVGAAGGAVVVGTGSGAGATTVVVVGGTVTTGVTVVEVVLWGEAVNSVAGVDTLGWECQRGITTKRAIVVTNNTIGFHSFTGSPWSTDRSGISEFVCLDQVEADDLAVPLAAMRYLFGQMFLNLSTF